MGSTARISSRRCGAAAGACCEVSLCLFGDAEQPVRIAQHDALAAALDQALLLPGAEYAADGMQRGAGHLGDVLAADREIDLHPLLSTLRPACLASRSSACATRRSTCWSTSRSRGYGFPASRLPTVCRVLVASAGMLRHEARPRGGRPGQRRRCRRPRSRSPDSAKPDRGRDAEGLARRHIAHDDLLAVGRRLSGTHVAVKKHEEGMRLLALVEHGGVFA